MKSPTSAYRRSIWCHDARYDFVPDAWTREDIADIARLASVDAAKKRIQPIPLNALLAIHKKASSIPGASKVTQEELERFYADCTVHQGAGIITVTCMLSVVSDGDYAPMDRKVARGLLKLGKLSESQRAALLSSDIPAFVSVYRASVLPAWRESRLTRLPVEADEHWGQAGSE